MKKLFLFLFINILFAANINNMLYKIAIENDLSNKTKKENSGILYVLTREDINNLQITHLRDVLKLLSIGYKFNRYGVIDVFNSNTNIPFLSSPIKIFIDNQEVTSGFYNSGLAIIGDTDLGWVDHIEVYTQAPSLDVSTEPSLIVIKLYSKSAIRDEGNTFYVSGGSKKSTYDYLESAKVGKYSYYAYLANDNDTYSKNLNLSRYKKHFLMHIYNDNSSLLADVSVLNRDGFLGFSLEGMPDKSYIKSKSFHLGYMKNLGNFESYLGISLNKLKTFYYKEPFLFFYNNNAVKKVDIYSFDRVFDFNVKYKKECKKNIFLAGIKNRFKYFNYKRLKFDNYNLPQTGRNTQNVHTFFIQDSYFLKSNSLINLGYSFSFFQNSGNVKNQTTKLIRIGHTFLNGKWTFKTNFSHIEYTLDTYLINSIFVAKNLLKPSKINNIFENIKYKPSFKHRFNFSIGYFVSRDFFFPDKSGLLTNIKEHMSEMYMGFRYNYIYAPFSKFSLNYYFQYIKNIPQIDIYRIHKISLYNYNPYKKWRFFEEMVIDKSEGSKVYYDLSLGAKYIKNDNLTLFIKGENLLNRALEYHFFSFDPLNNKFNPPIVVPFIERKVMCGLEYSF